MLQPLARQETAAGGYAFGAVLVREPAERRRFCLQIGLTATAAFVAAAAVLIATSPAPADAPPLLIRLLNQGKYPAPQLFLLMTLGPRIALLPLAERARGAVGRVLAVFGRVPLFYDLLHIPAIHAAALVVCAWFARVNANHTNGVLPYLQNMLEREGFSRASAGDRSPEGVALQIQHSVRALGEQVLDGGPQPDAMVRIRDIEGPRQFHDDAAAAGPGEIDCEQRPDQPRLGRNPRTVSNAEPAAFEHPAKGGLVNEGAHVHPNDRRRGSEQPSYSGVFHPPTSSTSASAWGGPQDPGS